jgi:hypothetical protein
MKKLNAEMPEICSGVSVERRHFPWSLSLPSEDGGQTKSDPLFRFLISVFHFPNFSFCFRNAESACMAGLALATVSTWSEAQGDPLATII